ncbi:glycosyltransferase family 2 protein [Metabacillus bambusae]|uniref:Glycosyltransferase family 2 protein n=1 Tax=Metabacillus bambusae TaxID=2795218 RepID=A0ABS3N167_9BACI|nr:glycosyltransferase family 2 protein [Metabacillus bambusae]MBO1511895.1 glycosyltransferase family 2 protein [Metabacillus bambusae]
MKISVCLSVYNGEQYLKQQLDSILIQVKSTDEIIIINDNSSDASIKIIKNYNDPRIRLYSNEQNIGVIESFEKAIEKATGDIIFLCDQDDVWLDNKVDTVINIFETKGCTLVSSDAYIVDQSLKIISDSFYKHRKSGNGVIKNIYKNTFLGCTLAFRKEIKNFILPFPKGIPMHDAWIGILNSMLSKTVFIDDKLIYYRRHDKNVTGLYPSDNLLKILKSRGVLVTLLLIRYTKVRLKYFRKFD